MKKLYTLLFFSFSCLLASAQTLNVVQGNVTHAYSATGSDMTFCCGTRVQIEGNDYPISEITKIVIDDSTVTPATVNVVYNGNFAHVTVSGDMAPYIQASVNGADVVITPSDEICTEITYTLSGTSSDGSFQLGGKYKSVVVLNGVSLTSSTVSPIDIENGKRISIVVADGTENTFEDNANNTGKAAFFVNGHAEFSGNGKITVRGNAKHAYRSDEYTWFTPEFGGNFVVDKATSDAMHVEQYLQVSGGTFSLSGMSGDGMDVACTNEETDTLNGHVFLDGGTINIQCATDDTKGIKADSIVNITGGSLTVNVAGDGCKGISSNSDLNMSGGSVTMTVSGTTDHKDQEDESKCRGMKVGGDFTFRGGNISMSVTGKKAKAIKVDGNYYYTGQGTMNCSVDCDGTAKKID